jgi:hypothetical protein
MQCMGLYNHFSVVCGAVLHVHNQLHNSRCKCINRPRECSKYWAMNSYQKLDRWY